MTNIQVQKWVVAASIVLFALKTGAYFLTNSVAVLTDALESTVNVVTGFIGLYTLIAAARPQDENHPYGHGKAELLSASFEGLLIIVAGLIIVYESLINLQHAHQVQQLDWGMLLIGLSAGINFGLGEWCIRTGLKNNSIALQASGKHLKSDTWTTLGIIAGLIVLKLTQISWVDSAVAIIFAVFIIVEGAKIIRDTVRGIMDEADEALLEQLTTVLNKVRKHDWIDLHNLRAIRYGAKLHLDCHLTVPWYYNVQRGHDCAEDLKNQMDAASEHQVEMFVHLDPCLPPQSCSICPLSGCPERKSPFQQRLEWTIANITENSKHKAG